MYHVLEKKNKKKQPKHFSYPKKKFGKEEKAFLPVWCENQTLLHYYEAEDHIVSYLQKYRRPWNTE